MPGTPHGFESRFRARSYELDAFGHVNHTVFLNWLEQARFDVLERAGFPAARIHASGCGVYLVRLEVDYLKEARQGDELVVRTRVAEATRTTMIFRHEAAGVDTPSDPSVISVVRTVWIGPDRKPARIPQEARVALGLE